MAVFRVARDWAGNTELRREKPTSALHIAARCGHGAELDAFDLDGKTALYLAAGNGRLHVARLLLKAKADVSLCEDHNDYSSLHAAVAGEHDGVVVELLKNGADEDAKDNEGATPLLCAIESGHSCVVDTLLAAGADCSIRQTDGDSAIHRAVAHGNRAILSSLLAKGADIGSFDYNGDTPLHIALDSSNLDAVDTPQNIYRADLIGRRRQHQPLPPRERRVVYANPRHTQRRHRHDARVVGARCARGRGRQRWMHRTALVVPYTPREYCCGDKPSASGWSRRKSAVLRR